MQDGYNYLPDGKIISASRRADMIKVRQKGLNSPSVRVY